MENVFKARTYVEFVRKSLSQNGKIPRGIVKQLADHVGCHSTYISQVLRERSHFNHEQAIKFCRFRNLNEEETEFFINLLNRDRAGNQDSRLHFERIINRTLQERNSLQKRAKLDNSLTKEQEILFFQSWTHHIVHAALQIPGLDTPKAISHRIKISEHQAIESLELLKNLKLAEVEKNKWHATKKALHIGKDSPLNQNFHSNWRLKIASLLMEGRRTAESVHFTSAFCISKKDVNLIRDSILNHLQQLRERMVHSNPEKIYTLCMDFFPLDIEKS